MTVARRKLIDMVRAESRHPFADVDMQSIEALVTAPTFGELPDERLAMMFACAHPAIEPGARSPLILQVVLGLDAKAIASAFLTSPAAMSKRLVRAKGKIREAGIPFRVPGREELPPRLNTVLEAIYAGFGEGWSDPGGADVVRRNLTEEALFLARLVVELMPGEPEALGLLALMLLADSRRRARRRRWRICAPRPAESGIVGQIADCRSGGAAASSGRDALRGAVSTGSGASIRARGSKPDGSGELGSGAGALRCAVRADGVARGSNQPGCGRGGVAWSRRGSGVDAGTRSRPEARRVPALLGGARRIAGQGWRKCKGTPRVSDRDWVGARSCGAEVSGKADGRGRERSIRLLG